MNRKGSRQNAAMKQCRYAALFLLCLLLFGCTETVDTTEIQRAEPSPETSLSFLGEPMPDLTELAQQKYLKHLDLRGHTIDLAQIEALQKALPDCEIDWKNNPTAGMWREHPRYFTIYEMFHGTEYIPFEE